MRERISTVGVTGALVCAAGLCFGIPVLLVLGSVGALTGITWGSGLLIGWGLVTLAFGIDATHAGPGQRRTVLCAPHTATTPTVSQPRTQERILTWPRTMT